MNIKGIEFKVNVASGALGWAGEGYWYHKPFGRLFPSFKRAMNQVDFIAKTTTWMENPGNLPLDHNYEPKELFPKCIKVYPLRGMMLNAVKLSGPGFPALLNAGKFENVKRKAFGISFMPIGETVAEMLEETKFFKNKLIQVLNEASFHFASFRSPIWVQINQSCPNTMKNNNQILAHTKEILGVLQPLRTKYGLVLDLKINFLAPNAVIADICENDLCDIITVSNAIKFGAQYCFIPWKRLFWWRRTSPLARFGGGALSGRPLFKEVRAKVISLHRHGIKTPIKASGGIFSVKDVKKMKLAGASAIEFATVASLRPWRVEAIINEAQRIF
jgi:dihydroorotate dehydrogenase